MFQYPPPPLNTPLTGWVPCEYRRLTVVTRFCGPEDRLPILVSGKDVTKLVGVPKLDFSSGDAISEACVAKTRAWGLEEGVSAMSFDTTVSNIGTETGSRQHWRRICSSSLNVTT